MKVGKTLQTLLSFFIAFAMVFPGAVKVSAIDTYPVDQNSIVLDADFTGDSTNDHTYAKAIWTYNDFVYLLVDSTHDLKEITLYSGSGSITSSTPIVHGYSVIVGSTTYNADESQGNTKDSHLTVFKFSLSDILTTLKLNEGGIYTIDVISEQGQGHWIIGGTLTIRIPKAEVKVSKTWQDGPKDDVSIQLYRKLKTAADSTFVAFGDAFTLTSANPTKTISNLNFTDNIGRIYTYTAKEVNIGEGYKSTVDVTGPTLVNGVQVFTIAIKNTYTPPTTDIKVTKVWKDGDDPSGRPTSLTYYLYADGGAEPYKTGTADGPNWNYTFKDLPKTQLDGTTIVYTVKEAPVPGYSTSINGLVVTNVRSAKTDVDVEKLWKDGDDPSGRPADGVTFNLLANGIKVDSAVLTSAKSWKHTFEDLDKYDMAGKLIKYTVTEEAVTGYTPTIDGLTITNLRVGKTDIPVEKFWNDDGPDGRPTVTINLLANGIEVAEKDITAAMDWKYTFSQVDKYDSNGQLIIYTIKEDPVSGYKSVVDGLKVTNTKVGTTNIDVAKIWMDDNDTTGRPPSITIYLKADGIQVDSALLNAEGNWKYTFKDKPAYGTDGKAITYTITEGEVSGYVSTVKGFEVTNVRVGTTEVSVDKVWKDDNVLTARPSSINVNLLANGLEVDDKDVTADMDWKYTFKDLDKYDDQGKLITYTITEDPVTGYISDVDGYTITNVRTDKTDIPVNKFWKDEGPLSRPASITVNLLANGEKVDEAMLTSIMEWKYTFKDVPEFDENGKKITYTITENRIEGYSSNIDSFTITNTRTGDKDIPVQKLWLDGTDPSARPLSITVTLLANGKVVDTAELTKEDGWKYLFKDKPIFDNEGKSISYTIKEKAVENYLSKVDGFTITNLRTGEIDIPVEKIWLDNGERTIDKITVNLYKQVTSQPPMEMDAAMVTPMAIALVLVDTLELNAGNDWKDTFMDLPEFDETGTLIDYFLDEIPVEGYSTSIKENEDGSFTITNLRTGITSVSGTKTWMDEDGTSLRPETITIILLRNGVEDKRTEIGEEDLWTFEFKNLPTYDNMGIAYVYSVDEVSVPGYETSTVGYDIFNLRTGEIDIPVEKIWLDNGERTVEEVTVNLYKKVVPQLMSAMEIEEVTPVEAPKEFVKALVLNAENEWKGTFEDLDEFDEFGYPIEYIVEEEAVEGYTSSKMMNEDGSFTFTNLRTGLVDIEGEKTWFDDNEESRPEFITVVLMRNGEEIDTMDITEVEGLWTYSFTDLDEFDEEGIAYLYEIEELPVEGYNTFILGFDIQNVRTGLVNVNGEKTWNDLMGRPESITINLLQNGVEIDDMVVEENEEGKWTYSFTELPEFDEDGITYLYSVTEDALAGYEPTVDGYNILNRQLRGTLRIVKTDDFDDPVENVIFRIEDENGVLIDTGTTDEDGILEFTLALGKYTVIEIYAPEDYIMDDEEKVVTIDEDGEIVILSVVNILEFEDGGELPDTGGKPKPVLPKTGAESTFIFYGIGAMLTLAGFTLLKKKKTVR